MLETKDKAATPVVVRPNTFATLLVHAEPAEISKHRVEVAARLAHDLGSTLIGLGAETFNPGLTVDPFMGYAAGEWIALVQEQIANDLTSAEASFRRHAAGADIEWRSAQNWPHHALTDLAYAADLIVVSPRGRRGPVLAADPADVVMTAGRPVLMVPPGREHLHGMSVVVAWKNTRESRRAVADALPFLQRAEDVIVHAVCEADDNDTATTETAGVVANLKRHGVEARALVTNAKPEATVDELQRVAALNGSDLIVAGAFGHSRLQEWVFGGVTDAFMHRPDTFVLMSH